MRRELHRDFCHAWLVGWQHRPAIQSQCIGLPPILDKQQHNFIWSNLFTLRRWRKARQTCNIYTDDDDDDDVLETTRQQIRKRFPRPANQSQCIGLPPIFDKQQHNFIWSNLFTLRRWRKATQTCNIYTDDDDVLETRDNK
ncbi:hypothetical protein OPV22_000306 [Ensete ventricosum]|uniref:Uncharacterized protein n=1 Tax=Ensete ventricosum TaxID=4639 RepID=A0AAV8RV87_ENSVE|nr:hypothetical protein OPV22_000306 [Ensete ventricosum]